MRVTGAKPTRQTKRAGIDLHIATGRDKREQAIETVSEPPPVF